MMDSDVSVLLHCAARKGLLESQVQVELSERFNRRTDSDLERHIGEVWTERVSKEPWLFNGSKFRLHSFFLASPTNASSSSFPPQHPHRTRSPRAENTESDPLLTLRLGLTCYKDYLGTNWSGRASQLRQLGEVEFGDPAALLAQPLGVGAILCTDDGQVVFIRRSQRVAEAGGLLDIPGGHPEPKVVCERLGHVVHEEQISMDMMQQRPVVSELFSSVCAEIRDEVNVPLSSLKAPVLMGVALNHTSAGRPSAEFYVSQGRTVRSKPVNSYKIRPHQNRCPQDSYVNKKRGGKNRHPLLYPDPLQNCSLTSDAVRRLYWKGGAEAQESTDIVFLSRREVLQLESSSSLWSEMCPSAKGAVLLYQTVKPDEE